MKDFAPSLVFERTKLRDTRLMITLSLILATPWPFSQVVFLNGILCHRFGFKNWDVFCNLFFCIHGLLTSSWQPQTAVLTIIAMYSFWKGQRMRNRPAWWFHSVFVQLPLILCAACY